jgi:hypothetical protein
MKGSIKEQELRQAVGMITVENHSPTLYAKLIKVNRKTCVFEPVYRSTAKIPEGGPKKYKIPLEYAWNAFFF